MRAAGSDRRAERRVYLFGKSLGWRRSQQQYKRRKGWLNDVSPSGMSFLVETPRQPQLGESLEVCLRMQGEPGLWRVVRVQPMDGELTMVGCRKDPASRSDLEKPYPPHEFHSRLPAPAAPRLSAQPAGAAR